MNMTDELARLGIALNAEEAAAWKGIKVPVAPEQAVPGSDDLAEVGGDAEKAA